MTKMFTCPVCHKVALAGPPGVCPEDNFAHTPAAALKYGCITIQQFDALLRAIDRRLYHLEMQLREKFGVPEPAAKPATAESPIVWASWASDDPYPLSDGGEGC